jgi:hypothetical protein
LVSICLIFLLRIPTRILHVNNLKCGGGGSATFQSCQTSRLDCQFSPLQVSFLPTFHYFYVLNIIFFATGAHIGFKACSVHQDAICDDLLFGKSVNTLSNHPSNDRLELGGIDHGGTWSNRTYVALALFSLLATCMVF